MVYLIGLLLNYLALNIYANENWVFTINSTNTIQSEFQTYIVEFDLVDLSAEEFAELPADKRKAIIDQLLHEIQLDTKLILDIRMRYDFVPSLVLLINHNDVQLLKNHSAVKSISRNSQLKAI